MLSQLVASIVVVALSASPKVRQSASTAQSPAGAAGVSGTVTRADTGKPIPGANAQLVPAGGGVPARAKADDRGRFEFTALPAGQYLLNVTADGFVPLDALVTRPNGIGRIITLTDGERLDKIDFTLALPGAIEGRVIDEFGDPAPGVTIQLAQLMQAAGKSRLMPGGTGNNTGPTDDKGQFRFFGLPPGDYYVLALSGPFGRSNQSAFSSNGDGLGGFAPTYFPGTDKAADAKPVTVVVGQTTPSLTIALRAAHMSTISGKVFDTSGQPAGNARLMLLQTQGGDVRAIIPANTSSAPDGSFVYRNVAAGTYVLQGYVANGFASVPITVPEADEGKGVSGVIVSGHPLRTARGRVTFEGAPPPAKDRVSLGFSPTDFVSGPVGGNRIPSQINDDWTFEITQLTWTGVIRVSAPPAWRLKSVIRGGRDVADTPTDFQTADVNDLEIVMTTEFGSVGGLATDGMQPATAYSVAIFSDDKSKWNFPSRFVYGVRANPQGQFRLNGLLSGGYLAVAVPALPAGIEVDPTWLASMMPLATPFHISGTESVTLSLKLVKP